MDIHPVADLFPPMDDVRFGSFREDIRLNGQIESIITYEGSIIDGRNRYRACSELNIEPLTKEWDGTGGTILKFVISKNLERRHLSESQRAMVAAKLADMPPGARTDLAPIDARLSQNGAAEMLNVSRKSVQRAVHVINNGVPELQEKVYSGEITVSHASEIASQPKGKQMRLIRKGRAKTKKILLQKKTQAIKKNLSDDSVFADCLTRALRQDEFLALMELIAGSQPAYKRYLDDVINEITEENLSDETRDAVEQVLLATDYGYQTKAKIREKTKYSGDFLEHVLTHCLSYNLLEIYRQGGKTDGARGASNTGYRRYTGDDGGSGEIREIAADQADVFDSPGSFAEKREKIINSLNDYFYQSARHLNLRTEIPVSDILLICETDEEIDFQEVGSTQVFYLRAREPYGNLYNGGDNAFHIRRDGSLTPPAEFFQVPPGAHEHLTSVQ
jgi:ParB-like chromosome segregation protein Spo0J